VWVIQVDGPAPDSGGAIAIVSVTGRAGDCDRDRLGRPGLGPQSGDSDSAESPPSESDSQADRDTRRWTRSHRDSVPCPVSGPAPGTFSRAFLAGCSLLLQQPPQPQPALGFPVAAPAARVAPLAPGTARRTRPGAGTRRHIDWPGIRAAAES
jgi:hypothetical protein